MTSWPLWKRAVLAKALAMTQEGLAALIDARIDEAMESFRSAVEHDLQGHRLTFGGQVRAERAEYDRRAQTLLQQVKSLIAKQPAPQFVVPEGAINVSVAAPKVSVSTPKRTIIKSIQYHAGRPPGHDHRNGTGERPMSGFDEMQRKAQQFADHLTGRKAEAKPADKQPGKAIKPPAPKGKSAVDLAAGQDTETLDRSSGCRALPCISSSGVERRHPFSRIGEGYGLQGRFLWVQRLRDAGRNPAA